MSALVLHHDLWPLGDVARAIAEPVATALGARRLAFDRRPHLATCDLVVLVAPVAAQLDPRVVALVAGGELRGKTLALVTDAPAPLGALAAAELSLLAGLVGGAMLYEAPLHLGPWLSPDHERVRAWAGDLARAFPAAAYPRGEAGRPAMGG